ncbi:EAL domain-containing protein (plasmid) [Kitasatospora sp. NBC_00070]|uniref:EAL domain-containing protein n=1 Tax=Kitasatospora sp. NBC_00070 TaxID=2975962 RepID=UPI002F91B7CC
MTRWRWPYPAFVFLGWMALLTAMYYTHPDQRIIWWTGIGLSGVTLILFGTIRNRPAHPLPWLLLAAANLSFTFGEVAEVVESDYLERPDLFPSIADGFYLLTYPLYAAGLLLFIRRRSAGRDRGSLLDALTFTAGLALLVWIYIVLPSAQNSELTWAQKAFSIAYPLGDILVLALLLRLLVPHGPRSWALQLLTVGTFGMLASDILASLIQLHGTWRIGTPVDLGWAAFYTAWGIAALHPSMVTMTRPAPRRRPEVARGRIGLLTFASLIAPTILMAGTFREDADNVGVVAAFSALIYLLVLARLAGVVATHREAVARERVHRVAVSSLAAATRVEEVTTALQAAGTTLPPADPGRPILLGLNEGGHIRFLARHIDQADWWSFQVPRAVQLLADTRRIRLCRASMLGAAVANELHGADQALVCPLALRERPAGDPLIGVLIVGGDEEELFALADTVGSLASQAALALERITLSEEVNRRNSEAYFRSLVQNASDVILILDEGDRVRYASTSADRVLGYPDLVGTPIASLVPPQDSPRVVGALDRMRRGPATRERREHWRMLRHDGVAIEVEVRHSDLRGDPTVAGLVLTLRDVTEQRQLERELSHQAFHDSLTGLANRVLFHDRVNQAFRRGVRGGRAAGVLLIDIDDFKVVNDAMGHSVGDELLVAVSLRLSTIARASDTAARLGGDEFAVLIEDALTPADAEGFAEHVIRAFDEPFRLSVGPVTVSVSLGVATTDDSVDSTELITHADLALYAAKGSGKRQWRRFQPVLQEGMIERHELQESLYGAVADSAFHLLYQPIVEIGSGTLQGFEALARWPHAKRGMVPPEQFITLAEESGQIVPLGAWVLGRATAEAARWQQVTGTGGPLYVSVNVSARQFRDPGFVDIVRKTLDQVGMSPHSLVLELTESVLMRRDDRVRSDLTTLSELGIRLAIDDFGTGYSSLSYLREFPITILKIDKSFIDGLERSPQQYALVEGITRIAETLGVRVIAEGIETARQRELLGAMGCPLGQGYLFSRPMPPDQVTALIRTGGKFSGAPTGSPWNRPPHTPRRDGQAG